MTRLKASGLCSRGNVKPLQISEQAVGQSCASGRLTTVVGSSLGAGNPGKNRTSEKAAALRPRLGLLVSGKGVVLGEWGEGLNVSF